MKRIKLYLLETRPQFFTATVIPILLGSVIGWRDAVAFNWSLFILTLTGGLCLHAGVNVTNDYFDHKSGNDGINREFVSPFTGGSRMIQKGLLAPLEVLSEGLICYAIGSAIGIYLVFRTGMPILWIGLVGVATSFFYTAPPVKLAHRGAGEIFVALDFGVLMTLGAYYVQTGRLAWTPLAASLPISILILLVLYINEFQDFTADTAVGKRGWVARLGREKASKLYGLILAAAYLALIFGVASGAVPQWGLAALLTLPIAFRAIKTARANYDSISLLTPANAATIQLHLLVGLMLTASYLVP